MTKTGTIRRLILASSAVMMLGWFAGSPMQAQRSSGSTLGNDSAVVRGGGNPVQVIVKSNGAPVAGITVTLTATHSVTATTDSNGVANFSVLSGHYTATASNDSGAATKSISVVSSTTTMIVGLALAPKTP